ncbi:MAG: putative adhesin, partial [Bacteroidota bacterium]
MIRKITSRKFLLVAMLLTLFGYAGYSQATCTVLITNDAQPTPNTFEFDVYLISTNGSTFQLALHQYGLNYNAAIKNGGTMTAAWVPSTCELTNLAQLQNTLNTTSNLSQIRIASTSAPGAGNGSIIAVGPAGTRVGRMRLTNTVAWANATPNITFSTTASATSTRTGVAWYDVTTNRAMCGLGITTSCLGTVTGQNSLSNAALNPPSCTSPTLSAVVTNVTCQGGSDGAVDLTTTGGSPTPFTYAWSNGATTEDLSGVAAGTYTVTVTTQSGGCTASASYTVGDGAAGTTNTTSETACDSYTWSVNGQTYTQSGTYSSLSGCNTEVLNLTITPSSINTLSETACDSYTWSANGQTYTQSGSYTSINGCVTNILTLTINNSTTTNYTETACDSYTWPYNGQTYTASGTYSSTGSNAAGCPDTHILSLTINSSTTNTTTASACDSYTWSANGQTYTQSGTYTSVGTNAAGCTDTQILVLTVNYTTNSNPTTASACGSYTWAANSQTYTQSGTYTAAGVNGAGCPDIETLILTITPQPPAPTGLACYETATFNSTTCQWDVTGTQPTQPTLACYETATFNNNTCQWDVTGTQPTQPTLACYETATFNNNTCQWDVTGTQPTQPTLACYETAT